MLNSWYKWSKPIVFFNAPNSFKIIQFVKNDLTSDLLIKRSIDETCIPCRHIDGWEEYSEMSTLYFDTKSSKSLRWRKLWKIVKQVEVTQTVVFNIYSFYAEKCATSCFFDSVRNATFREWWGKWHFFSIHAGMFVGIFSTVYLVLICTWRKRVIRYPFRDVLFWLIKI